MGMGRTDELRRRALVLAACGAVLLLVAFLGVPGRFNPQACTNDMLARGANGERSIDRSSTFALGYACEFSYGAGWSERVERTARWPLAVATVGVGLLVVALATRLRVSESSVSTAAP
jgi:hypothetical protein